MGCGSSKITIVKSVEHTSVVEGNEQGNAISRTCLRGDSAVSKRTADSGLGLEAADGATGRKLPPLIGPGCTFAKDDPERQNSHKILEQLFSQGIIPTDPRIRGSGEAYSVVVEELDRPLRRPPPRLESLMARTGQLVTKEDIEARMRKVEERRKVQEEEVRRKLRVKSARHRLAAQAEEEDREEEESSPSTES